MISFINFLILLGTVIFLGLLIYKKSSVIKDNENVILGIVALLLFVSFFLRYINPVISYLIFDGNLNVVDHTPIEYCRINALMAFAYIVLKKPKSLQPVLFFFGTMAFTSIIGPNANIFQLKYEDITYVYIVDHIILTLVPLWLIIIDDYKPSKKHLYYTLITVGIIAFAALPFVINYDLGLFSLLSAKKTVGMVIDINLLYLVPILIIIAYFYYNLFYKFAYYLIDKKKKSKIKNPFRIVIKTNHKAERSR